MKRRGVRLVLVVLFLVVATGAGVTLYQGELAASQARGSTRAFDQASQRLLTSLAEGRAALLAALVPGQGDDYWLPRAATAVRAVRAETLALKQRASDGNVLNDLDAAAAALDQVEEIKAEVARLLRADLRTQASAVAFGRGLEAFSTVAERVEGARAGELAHADALLAAARASELVAAGAVLALALVVIGLLVPAGTGESTETLAAAQAEPAPAREPVAAPAPVEAASPPAPAAAQAPAVAAASGGVPVDRRKAPELRAAADLCTDFARLVDAQELPALLDRAARLLDATGFIVWMADAGGHHLRPALAHGYSPQALSRLPSIPRQADNATAAAYRHAEMQIVRTNGMSPGAIVVPILGPSGCMGAIAAEVRHGREASESVRALARIVAAQVATLLGTADVTAATSSPAVEATAARHVG